LIRSLWNKVLAARCFRPALAISAMGAVVAGFVAAIAPSFAQNRSSATAIPYCAELKELNNYAMSQRRFAPIIGMPKEGNYRTTSLPLTGWTNCAFYGTTSYTCDSTELKSHEEAARAQQRIAPEILGCFAGTWAEAPEQMGPDFVVLHPKLGPASITLNLDETGRGHLVRLILFLRR
jgi:hypothetical protein